MSQITNLREKYSPAYFLAALGNGGLTITFFIFLQFMVPHKSTPIVTFDAIRPYLSTSTPLVAGLIVAAMAGILYFAVRHYRLLAWNIREYRLFKQTDAYASFKESNKGVSLSAIPLTLAMGINVMFVLGAVFVPGLWNVVEYMFPAALAGFLVVGIYALRIFLEFFSRSLATGKLDCSKNNSLSQLITVFAFSMVGVGFAASAAMSQVQITLAIGLIGSIFFLSAAALLGLITLVLGFRSMLENGVDRENSASLWIVIPILTVIGIALVRLSHGLHHGFEVHAEPGQMLVLLTVLVSVQLLFGSLGYQVMKRVGYFDEFVYGEGKSPVSYALICPGVALFVLGMFFVHLGLVKTGLIGKFSIPYFVLVAGLVFLQVKTIVTMRMLDRKLLRAEKPAAGFDAGVEGQGVGAS